MEKVVETLLGLLHVQTKKTDEALREELFDGEGDDLKLKDNALDIMKGWDVDRVSALKMDDAALAKIKGESFDKGHQKAKGELMTKFDTDLREKHSFESDLKGQELVDAIISDKTKSSSKGGEISVDDIKKHPHYLTTVSEHTKALKKAGDDWQTKYSDLENGHKSASVFGNVKSLTESFWAESNALFPEDARHANALKNVILSELEQFKYQKHEDTFVVLDADGVKVLEDKHGNNVSFKDHIKSVTENFVGFQTQQQRSSGGGDDEGGDDSGDSKSKKWTGKIPANDEEYMKQMQELKNSGDTDGRVSLMEAYTSKQS